MLQLNSMSTHAAYHYDKIRCVCTLRLSHFRFDSLINFFRSLVLNNLNLRNIVYNRVFILLTLAQYIINTIKMFLMWLQLLFLCLNIIFDFIHNLWRYFVVVLIEALFIDWWIDEWWDWWMVNWNCLVFIGQPGSYWLLF